MKPLPDHLFFFEEPPDVAGYAQLRTLIGWEALPLDVYRKGLLGALYSISVYNDSKLVGCGRIIGDGAIYFYLQDIMVHPRLQKTGVGRGIMTALMAFIETVATEGAFIGLMAAEGVEEFYRAYGFQRRAPERPGMFLIWRRDWQARSR